jgi:hypothetical protein
MFSAEAHSQWISLRLFADLADSQWDAAQRTLNAVQREFAVFYPAPGTPYEVTYEGGKLILRSLYDAEHRA